MSEQSQGPGWWQASDGKWYAPQAAQQPPPPPPRQHAGGPRYVGSGPARAPQQQPQVVYVKQKSGGGCFKWIGIAVVVLVVLAIIGGIIGAANSSKKNDGASSSSGSGSQQVFTVGQTAHTGDFDVKLESVENPFVPTNQFEKPPAGQHFVLVELTVTNTADDQKTLSTILSMEVHDAQSRAWNVAFAATDKPQLDGTVAKGESRRGFAAFAVGDDATGLTLRIKGDITSTGSVFNLG